MKRLLLLIALIIGAMAAKAQDIEYTVEFNLGYGTYRMSAMEGKLKDNVNSFPLTNYKTTDDFSGHVMPDIRAGFIFLDQHQVGLILGYQNTSGQNHVADYSGEVRYKIKNKGYKLGTFYRYLFNQNGMVVPFLEGSMGTILNRSTEQAYFGISKVQAQSDKVKHKGHNIFVQPAVGILFKFHRHFGLQGTVGYEFDIIKKMHIKGDKDTKTTRADWGGLRISAGVVAYL